MKSVSIKKKLTLSLDTSVTTEAKAYAKGKDLSLSALVESYLTAVLALDKDSIEPDISPAVQRLIGTIKLPDNYNHKEEYGKYLAKKYQ